MSAEKASAFVKKFYTDDDFMTTIIIEGEMYRKKGETAEISEEEQNKKIAAAAKKHGFDITGDEYKEANSAYLKSLGSWGVIKMLFHIMKIAKKARKASISS